MTVNESAIIVKAGIPWVAVGCYYCVTTIPKSSITEYTADNTPICPKCGIDAITDETDPKVLSALFSKWFFEVADMTRAD